MPGLVGIVGKGHPSELRDELRRMLAALYRTDDYVSGSFVDEKLRAYVGWTSFRGSYADCLPVRDAADGLSLFFAGEHFPPDPAEEARQASGFGCSPDKAEVLLPLFKKMGADFFPYLNGFFHGLIIDPREDRVVLFNDRFGMQRVYYHEQPDRLYFASEAKAILAVRPELRAFDTQGLGEWLALGAALEDRSLFKGILVLPPAAHWTWSRDGRVIKVKYFCPATWEHRSRLGQTAFYSKIRSTFVSILPTYLSSKGPMGISATGGLDTRMILANLGSSSGHVHCYSFNGPYRENLDVTIGRRVAQILGLPHTTLPIEGDFFRDFEAIAKDVVRSTDGNLEMSGAPNLYVNRAARQISPIRLTGNYGSEVLRRHQAFSPSTSVRRVLRGPIQESIDRALQSLKAVRSAHPLSFVIFRQIPWYSFNRLQAEQSALIMRSPFMDNAFLETLFEAPEELAGAAETSLRLIRDGNRSLAALPTDRGVTYPKNPAWIAMRAYHEFIFKMEYFASHGMPRHLARLERRLGPLSLERHFLGRNKYYHLHRWFRDELSVYVKDLLLGKLSISGEHLDQNEVEKAVRAHLAGTENNTDLINKLMTMELANRILLKA